MFISGVSVLHNLLDYLVFIDKISAKIVYGTLFKTLPEH